MTYRISETQAENMHAVMDALTQRQYMTRSELSAQCQLSLTTVGKIINSLYDYGVISQQRAESAESGRSPALFCLSDTAALVMLRIHDTDMYMDITDFRLRSDCRIHHRISPDCDPGEALMAFLLQCDEEIRRLHRQIMLCAMIAESALWEASALQTAIHECLHMTVHFTDSTAEAIARAALYQGITDQACCAVALTDHGEGVILHRGEVCRGARSATFSEGLSLFPDAERFTQALQTLTQFLAPDVLLICTRHAPAYLQRRIESIERTVPSSHQMAIEIRDIDDLLTCGMGIAMRRAWIREVLRDICRLRPPSSADYTPSL